MICGQLLSFRTLKDIGFFEEIPAAMGTCSQVSTLEVDLFKNGDCLEAPNLSKRDSIYGFGGRSMVPAR